MVLKTDPFKVDQEFLTPISRYKNILNNNPVIYVRTDSLPAGYYRIINCRGNVIDIATEYGLVTVEKDQCYYTQELITAHANHKDIVFRDIRAGTGEDIEWLDEVLETERRNNPINLIEL